MLILIMKKERIVQLKARNNELRQLVKDYDELPEKQNKILEEIKLNEEIIKFLER